MSDIIETIENTQFVKLVVIRNVFIPESIIHTIACCHIHNYWLWKTNYLDLVILINPQPNFTLESWSFIDYHGTVHNSLPDKYNSYIVAGTGRLTIKANWSNILRS